MMTDQLPTCHAYREVHSVLQQSATANKSIINIDNKDTIHEWDYTHEVPGSTPGSQATKIKILYLGFLSNSGH